MSGIVRPRMKNAAHTIIAYRPGWNFFLRGDLEIYSVRNHRENTEHLVDALAHYNTTIHFSLGGPVGEMQYTIDQIACLKNPAEFEHISLNPVK